MAVATLRYTHDDCVSGPEFTPQLPVPVNTPQLSAVRKLPMIAEQLETNNDGVFYKARQISSLEIEIYRLARGVRGARKKGHQTGVFLYRGKHRDDAAVFKSSPHRTDLSSISSTAHRSGIGQDTLRQKTQGGRCLLLNANKHSADVEKITYSEQRGKNANKRIDIKYRDVTSQRQGRGETLASGRDSMLNVTRSTLPSLGELSLEPEEEFCCCSDDANPVPSSDATTSLDPLPRNVRFRSDDDAAGDARQDDQFDFDSGIRVEICDKCGKRKRRLMNNNDATVGSQQPTPGNEERHSASNCHSSRSQARDNDNKPASALSIHSIELKANNESSSSLTGNKTSGSTADLRQTTASTGVAKNSAGAKTSTKRSSQKPRMRATDATLGSRSPPGGVFKDGDQTAYLMALNAARMRRYQYDMQAAFANYTSRAFTFSYFEHLPDNRTCTDCGEKHRTSKPRSKAKRMSPMKQVFGNVKKDQYFPGQIRNPFPANAVV